MPLLALSLVALGLLAISVAPIPDAQSQSLPADTVTIRAVDIYDTELTEGEFGKFILTRPFAGEPHQRSGRTVNINPPSQPLEVSLQWEEFCYSYCVADGHSLQGDFMTGAGVRETNAIIPAGKYTTEVTFRTEDDDEFEWDGRIVIRASAGSNTSSTEFTVRDNDKTTAGMQLYPRFEKRTSPRTPGAMIPGTDRSQFVREPVAVDKHGNSGRLVFAMFGVSDLVGHRHIPISYTISGTATLGEDYRIQGVNSNTVTRSIRTNSTGIVARIEIMKDDVVEDDETIILTLTANDDSRYTLVDGRTQATITITEDEVEGGMKVPGVVTTLTTQSATQEEVVEQVEMQEQQAAGEDGGSGDGTDCTVTPTADSLVDTVRSYHNGNKQRSGYNHNWYRVLIAFGAENHDTLTPFTAAEAKAEELIWSGWSPVREELERLDAEAAACAAPPGDGQQTEEQQEDDPPPPPPPPPPTATPTPLPTATPSPPLEIDRSPSDEITKAVEAKIAGAANDNQKERWTRFALGLTGQDGGMTVAECRALQARGPVWAEVWTPFCDELARVSE